MVTMVMVMQPNRKIPERSSAEQPADLAQSTWAQDRFDIGFDASHRLEKILMRSVYVNTSSSASRSLASETYAT